MIDFYSIENWCPRETIKDYVDEIIFLLGNFRPPIAQIVNHEAWI